MNANRIPYSWIGTEIMLARHRAAQAELVRLDNATERGLICSYLQAEITEAVFMPWSAISWIRPAVQEESNRLQ